MKRSIVRAAAGAVTTSGLFAFFQRRALERPRKLVLCYHRIRETPDLACSENLALRPADFAAQLEIVAKSYTNVGLSELVHYRGEASVFAITFDDGFRDNFETALPILKSGGYRAAFFITTGAIGSSSLLWQNRLQAYLRARAEPWEHNFYLAARGKLMTAPPPERDAMLARLRDEMGVVEPEVGQVMMTEEHIRGLADADMEILPHTVSHPRLTTLSDVEMVREIEGSRHELERILRRAVPKFIAYPFGDEGSVPSNIDVLLESEGYEAGFIVKRSFYDSARDSRFRIPRIGIDRDDSPAIFRLKKLLPLYLPAK